MEFKKYYEYFYNKTFDIGERKIKETLMKSKAKSLVFYLNLNIIKDTQNLLISKKSKIRLFNSLNELDILFADKFYDYSENNVELTLKNNIYPAYLKIKNNQLPSNYSFDKFLGDFGALNGLIDVVKNYQANLSQYEQIYDKNDFSNFKIIKHNLIKIETFGQEKHSENTIKNRESIISKNKLNDSDLIEIKPILDNLEKFTDSDKAFIYNLCLNEKYKIPMTEKVKLLLIAGEVHEINIYQFSKNFDTFYSKANKGIVYSSSINKTLSFIEQFIEKLSFFNLKETNEILASLRINIIFENKRVLKQNKKSK